MLIRSVFALWFLSLLALPSSAWAQRHGHAVTAQVTSAPDTRASMAESQASTAVTRDTAAMDLPTDFHRTGRIDFPRITGHFDTTVPIRITTGATSPSGDTSIPSFLLVSASLRILTAQS
jgi:hypothetical protein